MRKDIHFFVKLQKNDKLLTVSALRTGCLTVELLSACDTVQRQAIIAPQVVRVIGMEGLS